MRQSAEAKKAWIQTKRSTEQMFPFDEYPLLARFADHVLPCLGHIVLLGGGRGHFAQRISSRERTFFW